MLGVIRKILPQVLLVGAFLVLGPAPALLAQADETKANLCSGANLGFSDGGPERGCSHGGDPQAKVNNVVQQIVNVFSILVGIVAVIMVIYGGFRYVTSGGDSAAVTTAKNTILYAIVGLIIVALAQFIVKFVLNKVT